ncbi:MAG: type IX secretion system sortase PorU [Bacteroidaceae bacterium]|nr:type IX secretion system sortase PorU [Bacteroidaceae bacterium]
MNSLNVYCVCSLLACLPAFGQGRGGFTTLDWKVLRIDSVLPVYSEVVPLETDYRLNTYSVQLEYPEYAPLSRHEAEVVQRYDSLVGERIRVECSVGVLRKQGVLDLSFVPIVRQGGGYKKLLSARIVIKPTARRGARRAASPAAGRYAAHSVLSGGRWVKIGIREDGMYRLTRQALRGMGFGNPENVCLYGYGGHRQGELIDADADYDDLEEVPLYYSSAQDAWLFWGNGLLCWDGNTRVRNHYANTACYFLTERELPSTIQTLRSEATPGQVYSDFTDHVLYEKDEFAWLSEGRELYENVNYGAANSHTYKLTTPDPVAADNLAVVFSNGAAAETALVTNVNGTDLGEATMAATGKYVMATIANRSYSLRSHELTDTWNVRLTTTQGHDARLDYLALHYRRRLKPHEGFVAFSQANGGAARFDIAGSGLQVMRLGRRGEAPCLMAGSQEGETYSVAVDDASRRYVAFDPAYSFPQPTVMGVVENQDLHALDSLDMVCIIPASGKLREQAERLAQAHARYDGLRTAVVRADQVYNEFSSGTPDATAYRRFLKMLYDRAQTDSEAPRYLLLFGDAAWDNRMLTSSWRKCSPDDYLLCYESENSQSKTTSYVLEDYFGLLDDGEGGNLLRDKTDLGVGRFPVSTAAEARVMVDKAIAHMEGRYAGAWRNVVCVMGDDGDENEHMTYANQVAELVEARNPEMEVRKVMWDAYTRVSTTKSNTYPEVVALLKKQMEEGALVMNYTGHGNEIAMSHEYVLNLEDFRQPVGNRLPLWVTAACDISPFDGSAENIGEVAVLNPSGGAVAFYGTARTVYGNQNIQMNRYFMRYLFDKDEAGCRYRVGDAVRLSKCAIIADGRDAGYQENKVHFVLLGDPALTFGAPPAHVILDSINGRLVDETPDMQLEAGSRVRMAGHIARADGGLAADFQGVLSARLFDSEQTVTCRNNAGAKKVFSYEDRTSVLYNTQDSVRDGRFSFSFVLPVDINYSDDTGRVVFYALDSKQNIEANGYCEQFTLGGISEEAGADTQGPTVYAYLNDEEFQNGGIVNSQPFFVALLEDESGVNVSGNGLGHDLSLCIDGRADMTFNLNDYYTGEFGDFTRGSVSYSLPTLEAGPHSLTFRAWDVFNNTGTATLDFLVDPSLKPRVFHLSASQNPATTATDFLVSYSLPGAECTFTIDVYDFMGRRLWTATETGSSSSAVYSIPWNLCTSAGGRLGSGIYFYRCTVQSGESRKVSDTQKIIILNNK